MTSLSNLVPMFLGGRESSLGTRLLIIQCYSYRGIPAF